MTVELTLRVTDLEKKAIAFCREKDVPYPIANYLVNFANEVTKELQEKSDKRLKRHCNTIHSLVDELERRQKQDEELQKDNEACYKENEGLVRRFNELSEKNMELQEENEMLKQGYVWHDYDAGEDCYEDSHEGRWVKRDDITGLENQLSEAKDIIKLAIKGIKKIACEERCDFVNKEFFCDDCAYGKWIAKAEAFINKE